MTLTIKADTALSAPLPGTPVAPVANAVLVSDSFTGSDLTDVNGRVADIQLGGTPRTWVALASPRLLSGHLASPSAAGQLAVAFIPAAAADVEVSVTVAAQPQSGGICTISARANDTSTAPTNSMWRATLTGGSGGGSIDLALRSGGTTTTIASAVGSWVAGDRITLRCVGSAISVLVNGVVKVTTTNAAVPSGLFAGMISYLDQAARFDDFVVRLIDTPSAL